MFGSLPTTIFDVMSELARELKAINLGQGFPDDLGPEDVRRKAADEVLSGWNQYPPMMGLPVLREAIAEHYRKFQNLQIDPMTETMVTSGATEAIADSLLATIEPGDRLPAPHHSRSAVDRLEPTGAVDRVDARIGPGVSRQDGHRSGQVD